MKTVPNSNYSACELNVLGYLSELGQAAFLWARALPELADDRMGYRAEAFALEVERMAAIQALMLRIAAKYHPITEAQLADLWRFIMKRHAIQEFPGRKTVYKFGAMP